MMKRKAPYWSSYGVFFVWGKRFHGGFEQLNDNTRWGLRTYDSCINWFSTNFSLMPRSMFFHVFLIGQLLFTPVLLQFGLQTN